MILLFSCSCFVLCLFVVTIFFSVLFMCSLFNTHCFNSTGELTETGCNSTSFFKKPHRRNTLYCIGGTTKGWINKNKKKIINEKSVLFYTLTHQSLFHFFYLTHTHTLCVSIFSLFFSFLHTFRSNHHQLIFLLSHKSKYGIRSHENLISNNIYTDTHFPSTHSSNYNHSQNTKDIIASSFMIFPFIFVFHRCFVNVDRRMFDGKQRLCAWIFFYILYFCKNKIIHISLNFRI